MTLRNINSVVAGLSPYKPGKPIEELSRELGLTDIVKLASNENPLGASEQVKTTLVSAVDELTSCLLYTSPSPRDKRQSRMPSSA